MSEANVAEKVKSKATHDIVLTSGETIGLYIKHSDEVWVDVKGKKTPASRSTSVDVVFPDGTKFTGVSHCAPPDQFVKRAGLKLALSRALSKTPGLTKVDRDNIWKKVLPIFFRRD